MSPAPPRGSRHGREAGRAPRNDHDRPPRRRSRSRTRRSRSRDRDRDRDRDRRTARERSRSRDGHRPRRERPRTRSRSPARNGGRVKSPHRASRPERSRERYKTGSDRDGVRDTANPAPNRPDKRTGKAPPGPESATKSARARPADVKMNGAAEDGTEDDDDASRMARVMGFAGFRSTKNTKVPGNDKNYGVRKEKKAEYRQYMNRQGGFNRPLSPSA